MRSGSVGKFYRCILGTINVTAMDDLNQWEHNYPTETRPDIPVDSGMRLHSKVEKQT